LKACRAAFQQKGEFLESLKSFGICGRLPDRHAFLRQHSHWQPFPARRSPGTDSIKSNPPACGVAGSPPFGGPAFISQTKDAP
jgi:hypothetical protein